MNITGDKMSKVDRFYQQLCKTAEELTKLRTIFKSMGREAFADMTQELDVFTTKRNKFGHYKGIEYDDLVFVQEGLQQYADRISSIENP